MKKILIMGLLLLSLNVNAAGIIAELENEGGGTIALTDIGCKTVVGANIAYSNHRNGKHILGCWVSDKENVYVKWSDGDIREYPWENFKRNTKI